MTISYLQWQKKTRGKLESEKQGLITDVAETRITPGVAENPPGEAVKVELDTPFN